MALQAPARFDRWPRGRRPEMREQRGFRGLPGVVARLGAAVTCAAQHAMRSAEPCGRWGSVCTELGERRLEGRDLTRRCLHIPTLHAHVRMQREGRRSLSRGDQIVTEAGRVMISRDRRGGYSYNYGSGRRCLLDLLSTTVHVALSRKTRARTRVRAGGPAPPGRAQPGAGPVSLADFLSAADTCTRRNS